jgi:Raf kinase inhibitor-like YbhB/YbcL family protein
MRAVPAIVAVLVTASVAGCGGGSSKSSTTASSRSSTTAPRGSGASIALSSDFEPGATIARMHTCDGRDVSPPLHATGLPSATKELVVVMRDPDAPGGNFIHWVIAHLQPMRGSLSLPAGGTPSGAVPGKNSFGSLGYRGPCPPSGSAHHYMITVYALGQPSGVRKGFSADDVSGLPLLGQGTLTGVYARR